MKTILPVHKVESSGCGEGAYPTKKFQESASLTQKLIQTYHTDKLSQSLCQFC